MALQLNYQSYCHIKNEIENYYQTKKHLIDVTMKLQQLLRDNYYQNEKTFEGVLLTNYNTYY